MTSRTQRLIATVTAPWFEQGDDAKLVSTSIVFDDASTANFPSASQTRQAIANAINTNFTPSAEEVAKINILSLLKFSTAIALTAPIVDFAAPKGVVSLDVPTLTTIGGQALTTRTFTVAAGALAIVGVGTLATAEAGNAPKLTDGTTPAPQANNFIDLISEGIVVASAQTNPDTGATIAAQTWTPTAGTYHLYYRSRTAGGLTSSVLGPIIAVIS